MAGLLFNKFEGDRVRVLLGEWHMARHCTKPKRPKNSAWFKEKMLLVQAQESSQVLDEEQLAFLADTGVADDAYDSDCDDISSAKAVLMANLSSYSSDIPSDVPQHDTYQNDNMLNQSVVNVRTTPDAITEGSWSFEHTKAVFKQEVIPFIKTLWDLFKDFDNGLYSEINEVKTVFNQMEAAVEQYVMHIVMHADSVPVIVLPANNKCLVHDNLEIERLEQENDHLFELLLSQDIVHICVNSLATRNECYEMQQSFIHEYNENLMLKDELAKKEHVDEKKAFDEVEFFTINEWQAKIDSKDVSIANLRKHIENLKGKNVVEKVASSNNAKVIAPRMFKLDLEPLSPKVLNNWDAHIDYIKHTQENDNILQELVKHARELRPLDSDLDSACKSAKRIQEMLVYVTATCPSLTKPSEKLVAVTPLNKNRKVRFTELTTSSSNTQTQVDSHKTQYSNKPVLPFTGMKSSTSASRSHQ
ncbi:hypothetical protein Tco_0822361 [Tanacetum coccineum]|uniref:Integrase, catalytic region, zinc finger, CCHC-type, peptidase aspartic, catalytic n=1 Tax=Tanacetum coccineum TaxID=301880 RepID=A0ABQ5AHV7_9ASTR